MAIGAGLVLVGSVGIGAPGAVGDLFGKAASRGAPQEAAATDREAGIPTGAVSPAPIPGDTAGSPSYARSQEPAGVVATPSPKPSSEDQGRTDDLVGDATGGQPWLTLLIAGVGLFGISAALRFSLSPRAG
jgi:hypothetical protein